MGRFHLWPGALIVALCLTAIGCGRGLVKVEGKVTLDDKPIEGASVIFQGESGAGHPAAGQHRHLGPVDPAEEAGACLVFVRDGGPTSHAAGPYG